MNISTVLAWKREKNAKIKETYWLLQKYKSIGLVVLSDLLISQELLNGLQALQVLKLLRLRVVSIGLSIQHNVELLLILFWLIITLRSVLV